jgi:CheY-like chemotaxis protein
MAVILAVDDDLHILRVLSLWLTRNGHEVREARSGPDALKQLRAGRVDVLLSDVNMPGMTGLELLEAATRQGLLPPSIILLTSRCDQQEIAERVAAVGGVVHPKPFSPSRLIHLIEEKLTSSAAKATTPQDEIS